MTKDPLWNSQENFGVKMKIIRSKDMYETSKNWKEIILLM